jgi:hypothetical protein
VTMKEEDNIEKFFRKRLSEKEFDFDENQWARLKKKLDDEYPAPVPVPPVNDSTSSKIKWILLVILTALISFWSGWYLKTNTDQKIAIEKESVKQSRLNDSKINSMDTQRELPAKDDSELSGKEDHEVNESVSGTANIYTDQIPQPKTTMGVTSGKAFDPETDGNNDRPVSSFQSVMDNQISIYKDSLKERMNSDVENVFVDSLESIPQEKTDTIASMDGPYHRMSHVDYFAFVAPDFTGTQNSNLFEGAGAAFGIGASYYITARIRIGAGLTVNNKVYTAARGEYRPGRGFWTNRTAPMETEAKCLALDIPLNAAYRIVHLSKKSFWLNFGVSSYWLLTENYKYIYENPDPALIQKWKGERENSDFLSSVNLSVFYEQQLRNQLMFFVEPYYKLPVGQGIGHGSVELLSGGVNFGLRFRPLRKAKSGGE